jgi:hypothetical protein
MRGDVAARTTCHNRATPRLQRMYMNAPFADATRHSRSGRAGLSDIRAGQVRRSPGLRALSSLRLRPVVASKFKFQTRKSPARPIGTRFPFPAESGIGDSLFPGQIGSCPIGDSLPDSRPNRESGERELGISGSEFNGDAEVVVGGGGRGSWWAPSPWARPRSGRTSFMSSRVASLRSPHVASGQLCYSAGILARDTDHENHKLGCLQGSRILKA